MANITGTDAADSLQGADQNDTISGLAGNDTLLGQAGDDVVYGGPGDDRLYGGPGNDTLDGGGTRPLPWLQGLPVDYDQALYDDLNSPIALNLSTLQVTGSASGTDVLVNIEELRGTGGADSVTGSLNALPLASAAYQASLNWLGMGGNDTVTQARSTYSYWVDGIFANYIWSNAPLTVSANGSVVTVSYTASATGMTYANNQVAQPAGSDSLTLVSSYGDSRFSDSFNMSGLTENMAGNARNYVSVSAGNDTVTGNGDTVLNITSGGRVTSTTGKGVNFTLPGTGTATLNLTHLNWQDWSGKQVAMGQVTVSKIDEIRGTDFNDTLTGGTYDDYEAFRGKAGDDSIDGGTGYDMADYMGSTAGVNVDLWMGTAVAMDSNNSSIGTDTLRGIEVIRGTNHADKYMASQFGKSAPAGATVNVGSGIMGLSNGNSFDGRGGNDTIEGNGATRIDYLSAAAGVDADLQRGTAFAIVNDTLSGEAKDAATEAAKSIGVDSFTGVFRIRGSSLNDKLAGSAGGAAYGAVALEAFEPGPGNDTIDGRSGWDEVYYNTGGWVGQRGLVIDMSITNGPNVTEDSFGGKDTLIGIEYIGGSAFNDNIKGSLTNVGLSGLTEIFSGGKGNDTLDGGDSNATGYDEAAYTDSPQGVTVNLATGTASDGWGTTDTLISIEGVEGSEWNDAITGSAGNNRLDGRGGNDTLNGGDGNDWVEYNNASGAVTVDLGAGSASGAAGTDVLTSIENAQGSIYADRLTGSSAANVLEGLDGNDSLFGGAGNDSLLGGEGNDRLYGEAGDDLLSGGPRRNTSWGTGTGGDFDTADYNNLTSPISLNLQTLQVTGASAGTDTLEGIEEVRATKGADNVTGSLGLRSLALPSAQTGITWVGLGGSDTLTQSQVLYGYWADSVYADYAWSGTGIQATATAANKISVSYAAGTMYWYGGSQAQGTDQLTYVSSLGDTRWDDSINLSGLSVNMFGTKRSYVGLTSGNDTVVGNGDTTVNLLSSSSSASSLGSVGVSVTLRGDAETTVDMRHLSWQPQSSSTERVSGGQVKLSGVDDVRGTLFNDSLTGGGYDDYEAFRGRAGNDTIDGGLGYDLSDYQGSSAGVQVLLAPGTAKSTTEGDTSIGVDTLRGIEAIRGTNFNDVFDARGYGQAGAANVGDRVFNLADGNSFDGRAGNDQILGNGSTRIDYQSAALGVDVDLVRGSAFALGDTSTEAAKSVGFDSFSGVFRVRGSSFGDLLTGGSAGRAYGTNFAEGFQPGAGNDTVDGKDGWDEVYYGDGSLSGLVVDKTVSTGPQVLNDGHGGQDTLIGIEYVSGTEFADSFKGSVDNQGLFGRTESFGGGKGNDTLDGGAGGYDEAAFTNDPAGVVVNLALGTATDGWGNNDTLISIEGIEGSRYNDRITGSEVDNWLDGREGDDTLDGGAGSDWAEYNNANGLEGVQVDLLAGTAKGSQGNDTLISIENAQGTTFNDQLRGSNGANALSGMAGDDTLDGLDGNDTMLGGEGNDWFMGGAGNDSMDGGSGSDGINYGGMATSGIVADLVAGTISDGQGGVDQVSKIEFLHGTSFADRITLGTSNGYVFARAGNDTLVGGAGDQNFMPGSGNDNVDGGEGSDNVSYFDDGYDRYGVTALASAGVTVNLQTGTATDNWGNTDALTNIENVSGSALADRITGNGQNNVLNGDSGNDTLDGGAGNDSLRGGIGNDSLSGGEGLDQAFYERNQSAYNVVFNGDGTVTVTDKDAADGDEGMDLLSGIEQLVFRDNLVNTSANTTINGTSGNDTLTGTAGNNTMDGKEGNDSILGLGGSDMLIGGAGNDTLDGGLFTDSDFNSVGYFGSLSGVTVNLQTGVALDGFGGTDTLLNIANVWGSIHNDVLTGTTALPYGETFYPGRGDDTIDGGALSPDAYGYESNSVSYWENNNTDPAFNSGVQIDLRAGTATSVYYGKDVLRNIQAAQGTRFDDVILGSDINYLETFAPYYGNDTIDGRGGNNNVVNYNGAKGHIVGNLALGSVKEFLADGVTLDSTDTLYNIQGLRGSSYDDLLTGGNTANDGFERFTGNKGNDTIDGGSGYDRAEYNHQSGVKVQLGGSGEGWAEDSFGTRDLLRNIEGVSGSAFADELTGTDDAPFESFEGRGGNDTIDGRGGVDRLDLPRSTNPVTVVLGLNGADGYAIDSVNDLTTGLPAKSVLRGIEYVSGSVFNDHITGNEAANRLEGQGGLDTLMGGAGKDTLNGGAGNDSLDGGDGDDTAVFKGERSEYQWSANNGKVAIIGPDGADDLLSIEFLQFADQLVSLRADTTAPKLQSITPTSGSASVPLDANVVVQFDEPIKLGSGNISVSFGGQTVQIGADSSSVSVLGNSLIVNPDGDLPASTTFTVNMPAGFVTDLSQNPAAALNNYSFTTSQDQTEQPTEVMVDLRNLKLQNNVAANTAKLTFDVVLAASNYNGSKISGVVIDLDYDASLVASSSVKGSQYTSLGEVADSWSYVVPNLHGTGAKGRIAMVAADDADNLLTDASGRIATVTLNLKSAVAAGSAFKLGFAAGNTQVITENSLTSTVSTGAEQSVAPTSAYVSTVNTSLLGSKVLGDVSFTRSDGKDAFKTSTDGQASFNSDSADSVVLTPSRKLSATEQTSANNAVGLADAISILKMIVGLNVNSGTTPTSPYQVMAADFTQNGNIGLDDAIGVLKHVVGLTAPVPALMFVDAKAIPSTMDMDAYNNATTKTSGTNWLSGKMVVDVTQSAPVQVVGVLTGDVSGDWIGQGNVLTGVVSD